MNEGKRLSAAGEQLIERFEGSVLHPYNDPWNATIGIGHLIHMGPVTRADVGRYRGFTLNDAFAQLRLDVRSAEEPIRARVHVELNQNQWDALVSAVFNCGPGVLDGQIEQLLNARQWMAAMNALQAWCHGNGGVVLEGLVRRRAAERELFLSAPAPYFPADELRWEGEYDRVRGARGAHAAVRRRVLRRVMTARRKEIWRRANREDHGWGKLNRTDRYRRLLARTE